jgi:hypothetical protein
MAAHGQGWADRLGVLHSLHSSGVPLLLFFCFSVSFPFFLFLFLISNFYFPFFLFCSSGSDHKLSYLAFSPLSVAWPAYDI